MKKKYASCKIRTQPHYRHDAFLSGLKRAGYTLVDNIENPSPDDVLVIWNRYGLMDVEATRFERAGAKVIVAENGYLGVDWNDDRWYALSLNQHNGAGSYPYNGPERWDRLRVDMKPWRDGSEIVILPQRGIGPEGVAMPRSWLKKVKHLGRVRAHPGQKEVIPLMDDLKNAKAAVIWGSGAGHKCLLNGIPVFYDMPNWIGALAATPLEKADFSNPQKPDRLEMFRRLAWAMWRVEEIASGEAFNCLLS